MDKIMSLRFYSGFCLWKFGAFFACSLFVTQYAESSITSNFTTKELEEMKLDTILAQRSRNCYYRGAMMVETCYFIDRDPSVVAAKLRYWNPTAHSGLGVMTHVDIGENPGPDAFRHLILLPKRGRGLKILNSMRDVAMGRSDLNLNREEAVRLAKIYRKYEGDDRWMLRGARDFTKEWRNILATRMRDFQTMGAREGAYELGSRRISLLNELNEVIRTRPDLMDSHGEFIEKIRNGGVGDMNYYFETVKVQGEMSLLLGTYMVTQEGAVTKVLDGQFYYSHMVYGALVFYDLEAVDIGTRVWRKDVIISDPFVSRGGLERMASENVLLQEVKKSIAAFQSDVR